LVAWWTAEHRALERAHKALRLQRICPFDGEEPFAAIIRCTADPAGRINKCAGRFARRLGRFRAKRSLADDPKEKVKPCKVYDGRVA
jgi:hypothetical protein